MRAMGVTRYLAKLRPGVFSKAALKAEEYECPSENIEKECETDTKGGEEN